MNNDEALVVCGIIFMIIVAVIGFGVFAQFIYSRNISGVEFIATDNSQVQIAEERGVFGNRYFKYYDLPYTEIDDVYGNYAKLTFWFKERYKVNDTLQEFMHGPFIFTFNDEATESIICELNQNNITAKLIEIAERSL